MKKMLVPFAAVLIMAAQTTSSDAPQFTPDGQLVLPKDYREWVYLSSGLGMTYGPAAQADQGNPMFDNVFVAPKAYRAFVESGRWPDKTMFILEVRRSIRKGFDQQRRSLPKRGDGPRSRRQRRIPIPAEVGILRFRAG
jgi:hypothetical protein